MHACVHAAPVTLLIQLPSPGSGAGMGTTRRAVADSTGSTTCMVPPCACTHSRAQRHSVTAAHGSLRSVAAGWRTCTPPLAPRLLQGGTP